MCFEKWQETNSCNRMRACTNARWLKKTPKKILLLPALFQLTSILLFGACIVVGANFWIHCDTHTHCRPLSIPRTLFSLSHFLVAFNVRFVYQWSKATMCILSNIVRPKPKIQYDCGTFIYEMKRNKTKRNLCSKHQTNTVFGFLIVRWCRASHAKLLKWKCDAVLTGCASCQMNICHWATPHITSHRIQLVPMQNVTIDVVLSNQ